MPEQQRDNFFRVNEGGDFRRKKQKAGRGRKNKKNVYKSPLPASDAPAGFAQKTQKKKVHEHHARYGNTR